MPRKQRAIPAVSSGSPRVASDAMRVKNDVLGELADSDNFQIATMRIGPEALEDLARHGYSEAEVEMLVIPRRTLARRRAKREPLTVDETDRALRLARIARLAERVFGNPEKANRWLRKPKHALQEATPVQFLASESGARIVEQMLHRIEHGIFA
jgi:putative toxin-antitoxin system antitoxin component (TIGR02293 family)